MLADQMEIKWLISFSFQITRIEYAPSKGFLHQDIKFDNILMCLGRKAKQVYIINFGLAKRYGSCNQLLETRCMLKLYDSWSGIAGMCLKLYEPGFDTKDAKV
ncbi:putative protein kinase CK1-CK1 family [Helianthus anomalus]